MKPRKLALAAISAALVLSACGGKSDSTATTADASATAAGSGDSKDTHVMSDGEVMSGSTMDHTMSEDAMSEGSKSDGAAAAGENACPEHLVIQTDWFPELEHGGTYQLIGTEGTVSKDNLNYSGAVQPQYAVGGLKTIEINTVKFDKSNSSILQDGEADIAYINMSDIIKDSAAVDMVAVAKTLEKDPQMIMWDPAQHPIKDPSEIAATGAAVLHFPAVAYIDYMIGKGWMTEDQSDPSYQGGDSQWLEKGGSVFQQGFATNEVYKYENEIAWKDGKPAPVDYYTVGDMGFNNYPATITLMRDRATELAPCLKMLVPKMQQAWVDFYKDPQPVLDKLIQINQEYDGKWQLSAEGNASNMKVLQDGGFADNSTDGTYCSLDKERIQGLYDILKPIYDAQGTEIAPSIDTLFTNEYCADAPGR